MYSIKSRECKDEQHNYLLTVEVAYVGPEPSMKIMPLSTALSIAFKIIDENQLIGGWK